MDKHLMGFFPPQGTPKRPRPPVGASSLLSVAEGIRRGGWSYVAAAVSAIRVWLFCRFIRISRELQSRSAPISSLRIATIAREHALIP
jgi:hypothetical protein